MPIAGIRVAGVALSLTACLGCARIHSNTSPATPTAGAEASVAEYAVRYVRRWPVARLALDTSGAGRARTAGEVERLAHILHADTLVNGDSVMTCPGDPSTCRLQGGVGGIVAIRVDSLTDSSAEATIDFRAVTGLPRIPIAFETRKVRFVRRGGDWVFDRELWIEVSSARGAERADSFVALTLGARQSPRSGSRARSASQAPGQTTGSRR